MAVKLVVASKDGERRTYSGKVDSWGYYRIRLERKLRKGDKVTIWLENSKGNRSKSITRVEGVKYELDGAYNNQY